MKNAFGAPQSVLLLGGTSEIGLAIVTAFPQTSLRRVTLGCRDVVRGESAARALRRDGLEVSVIEFDGEAAANHQRVIDAISGDIDIAIVAFGQLGNPDLTAHDPVAAAALCNVDFAGAVSATVAVGNRMRAQGHGAIMVISSIAGDRVRKANPVYGGAKAGLDGFAQGYGDALAADGVHVMVLRPGFVHTRMTAGMKPAPFAATPEEVAAVAVAGMAARRRVVWAPRMLRLVSVVFRHLPSALWRRVSA